jgi:hypothetical protein
MKIRLIPFLFIALFGVSPATAATVNLSSPSGTVGMSGDGTNLLPVGAICGATSSATLEGNCANQAFVNASGQLGVIAAQSGTWNITNISGTITLPTNAATATGQTNPSIGAIGSTVPGSAALVGGRAENAEPAPASNGNQVAPAIGLEGKPIVLPYANKENFLRGSNNATGTSPTTFTGMGAQGAGNFIYITGVQCFNTSVSPTYITLNDSASTVIGVPANGFENGSLFLVPLRVALNTAATFTSANATTTLYCTAQGYFGT